MLHPPNATRHIATIITGFLHYSAAIHRLIDERTVFSVEIFIHVIKVDMCICIDYEITTYETQVN